MDSTRRIDEVMPLEDVTNHFPDFKILGADELDEEVPEHAQKGAGTYEADKKTSEHAQKGADVLKNLSLPRSKDDAVTREKKRRRLMDVTDKLTSLAMKASEHAQKGADAQDLSSYATSVEHDTDASPPPQRDSDSDNNGEDQDI
jgi:hypothetical protein